MIKSIIAVISSSFVVACVCVNSGPTHSGHASSQEQSQTSAEWPEEYARLAVMQNEKNNTLACGFEGDKWHSNHASHKGWAIGVVPALSQQNLDERKEALDGCERASDYAVRAIEQQNENVALKCNLQGPIWHNKRESHFTWAESQSEETLRSHIALRDEMLGECKAAH